MRRHQTPPVSGHGQHRAPARGALDGRHPGAGAAGPQGLGYSLLGVSGLILLIASINFVNLALARSTARVREIAVRKVVGAGRRQLVVQFLPEAVLISLAAMAVGLGLAQVLIPWFARLTGVPLSLDATASGALLPAAALAVVVGLAAGLYPSVVGS